jgi:predicted lysophospholipase L1 biosynthesis ABC-type transport system permease subunit
VRAVLTYAFARLRARRGRVLLAAGGIAAAGAMLGAAVTAAYGLGTAFDRSAGRAHLPDILATFSPAPRSQVAEAVSSLANVRASSLRLQSGHQYVAAGGHEDYDATVIGLTGSAPRGYALIAGQDLAGPGEIVVEEGLARAWHLRPGDALQFGGRSLHIAGIAVAPDNVAFPLARGPRVWTSYAEAARGTGTPPGTVNSAVLWLRNPRLVDVTLAQARSASFGISGLRFTTRTGLHALIGQAAGIVIALLVAFSLIAIAVAGTMLAASANAEVQRRLEALGLLRALGASPGAIVAAGVVEGTLVAVPAGLIGVVSGWLAISSPLNRLLASLSELGPGWSIAPLLLAAWLGLVLLVAAASAFPAWRATRASAAATLRRGDIVGSTRRLPGAAGPAGLGLRMALARPVRTAAGTLVLGSAVVVILLILSIATLLLRLDSNPVAIGKRYQLSVSAPASQAGRIARLPGVEAAAARYDVNAADSFQLGEPFSMIAYPGDHTKFEAPALAQGRRLRGPEEAEVGLGLAQILNLYPGSVLAAQLPSGSELRFRVVGVVRALERQGRVVYVQARRLVAAEPGALSELAVRLKPGAGAAFVRRELVQERYFTSSAGGITGESVQGWAGRSSGFIEVLVALLRVVAVIDGLVCLYAIAQMLALTVWERRVALAAVRALGAGRRQLARVLGAAAAPVALLAILVGFLLERFLVGPVVARLAASYVTLSLRPSAAAVGLTAAGLCAGAVVAVLWTARLAERGPVVDWLRET